MRVTCAFQFWSPRYTFLLILLQNLDSSTCTPLMVLYLQWRQGIAALLSSLLYFKQKYVPHHHSPYSVCKLTNRKKSSHLPIPRPQSRPHRCPPTLPIRPHGLRRAYDIHSRWRKAIRILYPSLTHYQAQEPHCVDVPWQCGEYRPSNTDCKDAGTEYGMLGVYARI